MWRRRIRVMSWGLLMASFFLPFARGCNVDVAPYQMAFSRQEPLVAFSVFGLPWLYPILLLGLFYGLRAIRGERLQYITIKIVYGILFCLLTFLIATTTISLYGTSGLLFGVGSERLLPDSLLAASLVVVFGVMGFGLKRASVDSLFRSLTFVSSATSAVWVVYFVSSFPTRLIGAWLSLISSITAVSTSIDGLRNRRHAKNGI